MQIIPMKYDINREPLKAGDPVTIDQLVLDHIIRWLEKTTFKEEAAKVLGCSVRKISRWLDEFKAAYLKHPRGTKDRDRGRTQSDDSETSTED